MRHSSAPISPRASPKPPPSPHQPTEFTCHSCNQTCGTSFYQCPHPTCDYRLDLLCVLQLKIKHRSHKHAMTLIRLKDSCSLTCGACNSKHESESEPETDPEKVKLTMSYICSLCGYWIHPDCASLLNPLHYKHHPHSLFSSIISPLQLNPNASSVFNFIKEPQGAYARCKSLRLRCCARLPVLITHLAHAEHNLVLHSKAPKIGFSCRGCHLRCYYCETCNDFTLDVVCGLINPAITHEPHKSTHILFMSLEGLGKR
ncbi:hypothetical protein SASPL_126816 [Salvia splendens]|uniref:DC1 domain-containing protein n=1 Tax=Salvia splendens TaxID=180675 RepID=A0A8X8XID7_SALSN|nr:hypothetical protein SASPL_126816 [Salvia splendens]